MPVNNKPCRRRRVVYPVTTGGWLCVQMNAGGRGEELTLQQQQDRHMRAHRQREKQGGNISHPL